MPPGRAERSFGPGARRQHLLSTIHLYVFSLCRLSANIHTNYVRLIGAHSNKRAGARTFSVAMRVWLLMGDTPHMCGFSLSVWMVEGRRRQPARTPAFGADNKAITHISIARNIRRVYIFCVRALGRVRTPNAASRAHLNNIIVSPLAANVRVPALPPAATHARIAIMCICQQCTILSVYIFAQSIHGVVYYVHQCKRNTKCSSAGPSSSTHYIPPALLHPQQCLSLKPDGPTTRSKPRVYR